jgi:DedD protein
MMERALKERIIGAVVLVVFVVLVVPVFLDGPPDDSEVVTERVLLPGQEDQKTQTVVLDRDRTEPVPVPSAPQDEAEAEPQQAEPEPEQETIRRPEPSRLPPKSEEPPPQDEPEPRDEEPASSTGMWAVQLGSFGNKENAERLAAELRKQGYAAFLSQLNTDSGTLHRVRIGPQKDRDSAEEMAARLQKAGHTGQVVPHP